MAETGKQGNNSGEHAPEGDRNPVPVPESWGNPELWEERTVMSGQFTRMKESAGIYETVPIEG